MDKSFYVMFFDLDGTLARHKGRIPLRTVRALKRAKAEGNYIFLNSGRSKANTPRRVFSAIPWDGMVCGSSYVEFLGEIIYNRPYTASELSKIVGFAKKYNYLMFLEGVKNCYPIFLKPSYVHFETLDEKGAEEAAITKITIKSTLSDEKRDELREFCNPITPGDYSEALVKGHNKATGMKKIAEKLGVSEDRIVAFGDSVNDLDAFKYAGINIAMKKAPDVLKELADFVATNNRYGVIEGLNYLKHRD